MSEFFVNGKMFTNGGRRKPFLWGGVGHLLCSSSSYSLNELGRDRAMLITLTGCFFWGQTFTDHLLCPASFLGSEDRK